MTHMVKHLSTFPRIGITTIETTACKQWAHFQLLLCQVCRRDPYLPSWKAGPRILLCHTHRYHQDWNTCKIYSAIHCKVFWWGAQEAIFISINKDAKLPIEVTRPFGFFSLTKGTKKAKQLKAWEPALLKWTINSSTLCEVQQSLLKQRS